MWTRQNDGPSEVNTGSGSSLQLNFNPLKASDGDNYTCIAIVDIPDVPDGISVGGVKSTDIEVTCKCMHIYTCLQFQVIDNNSVRMFRSRRPSSADRNLRPINR